MKTLTYCIITNIDWVSPYVNIILHITSKDFWTYQVPISTKKYLHLWGRWFGDSIDHFNTTKTLFNLLRPSTLKRGHYISSFLHYDTTYKTLTHQPHLETLNTPSNGQGLLSFFLFFKILLHGNLLCPIIQLTHCPHEKIDFWTTYDRKLKFSS